MRTITLTEHEARLASAAFNGLAQQLAQRAERLHHGRAHLDAMHAVGTLQSLARRVEGEEADHGKD